MMNNFDSAGKSMLPFHRKKMGNNVAKAEKKSLSFKCQVRNKFDNVGNSINNFYPLPFHRKILSNNVAKPEKRSCIRPDRQTDNSAANAAKLYLSSVM